MIEVPPAREDPTYRQELLGHIQAGINQHPRSRQAQVGPSEIGGCETKLAFKLAYGGDTERAGGWAAHKGTVLHRWLDEAVFGPVPSRMPDGTRRWYSEMSLEAVSPHVNGGTLDLYDRLYATAVDAKFPGEWSMKKVRGGVIPPAYYVQVMTYALGLEAMGHPVNRAALLFLPQCGDELHATGTGARFLYWDFHRQVALDALANVARIQNMLDAAGPTRVLEVLGRTSDFCSSCPAFIGNNDRRATCPGAGVQRAGRTTDPSNPFARKG